MVAVATRHCGRHRCRSVTAFSVVGRQVWHRACLPCVANSYEFLALYICLSKEKAVFVGIEGLIQAEAECISV